MKTPPQFTGWKIFFLIALATSLSLSPVAYAQQPTPVGEDAKAKPVIFTTKEDRGNEEEGDLQSSQSDRRSLKDAVGNRFKLGVGVSHRVVGNPDDAALIRRHFQLITPENCMKPQAIHPAEDQWNFESTDRFVDFARSNNLEVVGHCLVWAKDDRTDKWMMLEDGKPVS